MSRFLAMTHGGVGKAWRPVWVFAAVGGGVAGVIVSVGIVRARGQLDGDGLGAGVELTFASVVLTTAVVTGTGWLR